VREVILPGAAIFFRFPQFWCVLIFGSHIQQSSESFLTMKSVLACFVAAFVNVALVAAWENSPTPQMVFSKYIFWWLVIMNSCVS